MAYNGILTFKEREFLNQISKSPNCERSHILSHLTTYLPEKKFKSKMKKIKPEFSCIQSDYTLDKEFYDMLYPQKSVKEKLKNPYSKLLGYATNGQIIIPEVKMKPESRSAQKRKSFQLIGSSAYKMFLEKKRNEVNQELQLLENHNKN
jgi:hypothetical protein